jgi:hypothetical protein
MIGFNPTPELRNYSRIIITNIKAFIFKQKLKIKTQVNSHETDTVSKFRVETPPFRLEITTLRLNSENLKTLLQIVP